MDSSVNFFFFLLLPEKDAVFNIKEVTNYRGEESIVFYCILQTIFYYMGLTLDQSFEIFWIFAITIWNIGKKNRK